jgi:hypothetical protein
LFLNGSPTASGNAEGSELKWLSGGGGTLRQQFEPRALQFE